MCIHHFVETGYSNICILCGVEQFTMCLDSYSPTSAPIARPYDRAQRFGAKVDRLLGTHMPPPHDPVWGFLDAKKGLRGPISIRAALRHSTLRNKHYDNVRTFCDAFTPFRCKVYDHHKTRSFLLDEFEFVHARWCARNLAKFFSYDWLLRYFLEKINSPLLVYLKHPTSKRRSRRYVAMLK